MIPQDQGAHMCKALIPHLQARADGPRGTRYTCTPRVLIPRALIGPSTQKDRKAHACAPRSIIRALRRTLTCTHHLQPHRTPPPETSAPPLWVGGTSRTSPSRCSSAACRQQEPGHRDPQRCGEGERPTGERRGEKKTLFPTPLSGADKQSRSLRARCAGGVSNVRTSALRDPHVQPQPTSTLPLTVTPNRAVGSLVGGDLQDPQAQT